MREGGGELVGQPDREAAVDPDINDHANNKEKEQVGEVVGRSEEGCSNRGDYAADNAAGCSRPCSNRRGGSR